MVPIKRLDTTDAWAGPPAIRPKLAREMSTKKCATPSALQKRAKGDKGNDIFSQDLGHNAEDAVRGKINVFDNAAHAVAAVTDDKREKIAEQCSR